MILLISSVSPWRCILLPQLKFVDFERKKERSDGKISKSARKSKFVAFERSPSELGVRKFKKA